MPDVPTAPTTIGVAPHRNDELAEAAEIRWVLHDFLHVIRARFYDRERTDRREMELMVGNVERVLRPDSYYETRDARWCVSADALWRALAVFEDEWTAALPPWMSAVGAAYVGDWWEQGDETQLARIPAEFATAVTDALATIGR
jgi:hypothetical protein